MAQREMQVSPEGFLIASEVGLALVPDRAKSKTAILSTSKKINTQNQVATDSTGNNAQAVAPDILSWIRKSKETSSVRQSPRYPEAQPCRGIAAPPVAPPRSLPPAPSSARRPPTPSTASPIGMQLFRCEYKCGFKGSFEEVSAHESACPVMYIQLNSSHLGRHPDNLLMQHGAQMFGCEHETAGHCKFNSSQLGPAGAQHVVIACPFHARSQQIKASSKQPQHMPSSLRSAPASSSAANITKLPSFPEGALNRPGWEI